MFIIIIIIKIVKLYFANEGLDMVTIDIVTRFH